MSNEFDLSIECAKRLDAQDPLAHMRQQFEIPKTSSGAQQIYLVGNSLGLPPKRTHEYVIAELDKWQQLGVRGHFETDLPWAPYHEFLSQQMADLVGATAEEVIVMNSLTVNLHLMMVSFYRPTATRHKILIEEHAFPSDHFAVESQIRHHGFDPEESLIMVKPRNELIELEDIEALIIEHGDELALVMLPGVQYYTGQVLPIDTITQLGHKAGAKVGFDLAHAAGNIELNLHHWDLDFAIWCTYKYLNSGPGATGACFVHGKHLDDASIQRFHGWWGTNKERRFEMGTVFDALPTAEAWQLSNAPILSMAAIRASLDVFTEAGGIKILRSKTEIQVAYLDYLLESRLGDKVTNISPKPLDQRGCQFALRITAKGEDGIAKDGKAVFDALELAGVACDWRYPDVIRIAAVPLYNSFEDIFAFVQILEGLLK